MPMFRKTIKAGKGFYQLDKLVLVSTFDNNLRNL